MNERVEKMNAEDWATDHVLEAAAAELRTRGFIVDIGPGNARDETDAYLHITQDGHHLDYAVDIKGKVTTQTVGAYVTQIRNLEQRLGKPALLVTEHINAPTADRLVALSQQFADAAGNTYLRAPGLYVLVTGRKPHVIAQDAYRANAQVLPARAFAPAGLKTLFAFICRPELVTAPYRQIAEAAGVALGGLPAVLAGLQQEGYLIALERKRRLLPNKRMLDDWAAAYARTLRPKQLVRTLVAPTFENWRDWPLPERTRWGGEPAAALLTNMLRPGVLTLYADKPPFQLMVKQRWTSARPLDEYNLIEVRAPFWGEALLADNHEKFVPPPLVYADLLAVADARCIEAAQQIYEDFLARLFPNQ